jgi:outer membrane protein assembly factor BamD
MTRLRSSWWWLGLLALTACAGRMTPDALAPEARLLRARQYVRQGKYVKALPLFQQLTFELGPSQPELAEARYYIAECYFQTRDYVQAAQEFRRASDGHPDSPWAPLALLRAGDANLRLWRRPELDPSYGEAALAIYQELAGRYPGSDAAARAQQHVRILKDRFAEKAYKTGLFYLKRRAYDSAILYFKDVIATYPDAARVPDALLRLVDAYRAVRYTEEVQETCDHVRRYYPETPGLAARCPVPGDAPARP